MPFKLTDHHDRTRNRTQWGPGVSHAAEGNGADLCTDGWIHYYPTLELAVLMNPMHANFADPHAWEFVPDGEQRHEPLKSGCKRGTTVCRVALPAVTTNQRVYFAIRCARHVCRDPRWVPWADAWVAGANRTTAAAHAARAVADAHAARAVAYAAAARATAAAAYADAAYADAARAAYANAAAAAAYADAARADAYANAYAARAAYADAAARYAADAARYAADAAAACYDGAALDFAALAVEACAWSS